MKKTLIIITAFLIVLCMSSSFADSSDRYKSISFAADIRRLVILQNKFNATHDPVEKYYYSQAMLDYMHGLEERIEIVNDVYYKTAILILTGEIDIPQHKTNYISPDNVGP